LRKKKLVCQWVKQVSCIRRYDSEYGLSRKPKEWYTCEI